jgi:hypothetical protein
MEGWNEFLGGHQNAKRIRFGGYCYHSKDAVNRRRPLLQRSVGYTQHPSVHLSITLPEHLPRGWAGILQDENYIPSPVLSAAYHEFAL